MRSESEDYYYYYYYSRTGRFLCVHAVGFGRPLPSSEPLRRLSRITQTTTSKSRSYIFSSNYSLTNALITRNL